MTGAPFSLHLEPNRLGAPAGTRRIGLDGLLARRGSRIWRAWVRGSAARHGFRWSLRDTFDTSWWPQGIDVAEHAGHRFLAVSWFAHDRDTRITIVDLDRHRYHHVLLRESVQDAAGHVGLAPIVIHAGGIAWLDGRILVADTFGGLREFRLDDLAVDGDEPVLIESARYHARKTKGDRGMRFSFVSIEHTDGSPRLVAGEYGDGARADRAARFSLDLDADVELHEPGLYRMQGIVIVDGTWYITTSNGEHSRGDLWVGVPGELVRHRHVLPAGPEDLAFDRSTRRLWSLSEWPGRRRVFQVDPARLPR